MSKIQPLINDPSVSLQLPETVSATLRKFKDGNLNDLAKLRSGFTDFQALTAIDRAIEMRFITKLHDDPNGACQWLGGDNCKPNKFFRKLLALAVKEAPAECFEATLLADDRAVFRQMLNASLKSFSFKNCDAAKLAFLKSLDGRGPDKLFILDVWKSHFATKNAAFAVQIANDLPDGHMKTSLLRGAALGFAKSNPELAVAVLKNLPEISEAKCIRDTIGILIKTDFDVARQYLEGSSQRAYLIRSLTRTQGFSSDTCAKLLTWAQTQDPATNHFTTCAVIEKVDGLTTTAACGLLESLPFDRTAASTAVKLMVKSGDYDVWKKWIISRGGLSPEMLRVLVSRLKSSSTAMTAEWVKTNQSESLEILVQPMMQN